mgnify:CR=1 FL=1
MGLLNLNKFKIVGTIVEASSVERMNKFSGHNEITSTVTVKSIINGKENLFTVTFKAGELTSKNLPNKFYSQYQQIENNFLNRKVEIIGQLSENFMFGREDTEISFTKLMGKFISGSNKADEANFTLGGVVLSSIEEKRSKKTNEFLGYYFKFGQANYKEDNLYCFSLDIPADDNAILEGIKTYNIGDTTTIQGNLRSFQTIETYETMKKVAFGSSQTEQRVNRKRYFYVSGGETVLSKDDSGYYSPETVKRLVAAYKEKQMERQQKHNDKMEEERTSSIADAPVSTEAAATAPARPSNKQASLL